MAMTIRYALLPGFGQKPSIGLPYYLLLILTVVCLAAAGHIINAIFNVTTDSINKPNKIIIDQVIKRRIAFKLYFGLNVLGLFTILFILLSNPSKSLWIVFSICVLSPIALAIYSIWLKKIALLGNILISILVGASIFCFGLALVDNDQSPVFYFTILTYALLGFSLNLSRELIKDVEDLRGDYYCKMKTLPILIGRKRSNHIIFGLLTFTILILLTILLNYFLSLNIFIFYVFVFVLIPLILISKRILKAKNQKDYTSISFHLKLVFLIGISSMFTFLNL
ncbi:geranylgeranylglycerol-phosphate geranylgeranyltransferase [Psychroflexus torquis]|nr:geranylgeranylglycerol-phosphate geranylgeranyltransferase [Psychroflexus torquis]